MDMRFYWTCDCVEQRQLNVYYCKGEFNFGDYHSKHHPPAHHIKMRTTYLYVPEAISSNLQGCVNTTVGTEKPSGKHVAIQSHYNNGTNKDTTGKDIPSRKQVTM